MVFKMSGGYLEKEFPIKLRCIEPLSGNLTDQTKTASFTVFMVKDAVFKH